MAKLSEYIWSAKYRPTKIANMSLHKEHKKAFIKFIKDENIPHLLLEGPQGSGKTTMAYILMNLIPCTKLILNASGQDRGIDTIKGKVKQFAGSAAIKGKIKIILMDEADALTKDAQTALRNTMETYSANCRFILTCNYVDKVIPPIQSRCNRFTFDQFPKRKLVKVCEDILENENIDNFIQADIKDLINKFYPDVRSVINNLQTACLSGEFNLKALGALKVDPAEVGTFLDEGRVQSLRQYIAGTVDFAFLYRWLFDEYLANNGTDEQKSESVFAISEALSVDQQVPDREINFIACCLSIMDIMGAKASFSK